MFGYIQICLKCGGHFVACSHHADMCFCYISTVAEMGTEKDCGGLCWMSHLYSLCERNVGSVNMTLYGLLSCVVEANRPHSQILNAALLICCLSLSSLQHLPGAPVCIPPGLWRQYFQHPGKRCLLLWNLCVCVCVCVCVAYVYVCVCCAVHCCAICIRF